jgi:hypothetical protein
MTPLLILGIVYLFWLVFAHQHLNIACINLCHGLVSALITRRVTGFTAVEVVLSTLLANKLSIRCDLESLRDRFLGLLLHRIG